MLLRSLMILALLQVLFITCNSPDEKFQHDELQKIGTQTVNLHRIEQQMIDFLASAAEMRKINIIRGQLVQQKSPTPELREYGALLVEEQLKMLKEINDLVALKKIALPRFIDLQSNEQLVLLRIKTDKEFDRLFVEQMIQHHNHEAELFRTAMTFRDPDVKIFAIRSFANIEKNKMYLEGLDDPTINKKTH